MFTGLVEAIGSESIQNPSQKTNNADLILLQAVTSLEPLDTSASGGGGTSLTIGNCAEILRDVHLGDSIAVNGRFFFLSSFYKLVRSNVKGKY